MNELCKKGLIQTEALTVTGKTIKENIQNKTIQDNTIIRSIDNPYHNTGGLAILRGNLAPDGAVVKESAVAKEMLHHEGPARVFDSEEDAASNIRRTNSQGRCHRHSI